MPDLFGGKDHIGISLELLRDLEPEEGYWLAFSGGKDSVVIKSLADQAGVRYTPHYNICPDPPPLIRFIREHHPDVVFHHPKRTMWNGIVMSGPPTHARRWCCAYMKHGHGKGMIVTGVRAQESRFRADRKTVEVCRDDVRKTYLHPIMKWTEHQVWEYIHALELRYCRLYDEGCKRLGCILCPMVNKTDRQKQRRRWPKYENLYIRAMQRYWKKAAERSLSVVSKFDGEEDFIEWWLTDPREPNKAMIAERLEYSPMLPFES